MLLTIEEKWITIPKVHESRKGSNSVPFGKRNILNLNHVYTINITLIINVFKFFQNNVTGTTMRFICIEKEQKLESKRLKKGEREKKKREEEEERRRRREKKKREEKEEREKKKKEERKRRSKRESAKRDLLVLPKEILFQRLTKEGNEVVRIFDQVFQQFSIDRFDCVFGFLKNQPLKDILFCSQISLIDTWCTLSEVDQSWELFAPILLSNRCV